jgi:hypothetical protein
MSIADTAMPIIRIFQLRQDQFYVCDAPIGHSRRIRHQEYLARVLTLYSVDELRSRLHASEAVPHALIRKQSNSAGQLR